METASRPPGRQLGQGGFTLIELITVIALLAVLGTAGIGSFQHMTHKAQVTALDESLRRVAVAVDVKVVLEKLSPAEAVGPAITEMKNAETVEFVVVSSSEESVVIQARPRNSDEPCRQLDLMKLDPGPCGQPPVGPPTSTTPVTVPPAAAPESDDDDKEKDEKAGGDEDVAKAEEEAKRKEEAQREEDEKAADGDAQEFTSKITEASSRLIWWKKLSGRRLGEGEWIASFTFHNPGKSHQYLDVTITVADENEKEMSRTEKSLEVSAGRTAKLEVPDNLFYLEEKSGAHGAVSVTVRVLSVTVVDKDGKGRTSEMKSPTQTVKAPVPD